MDNLATENHVKNWAFFLDVVDFTDSKDVGGRQEGSE